MVYVARDTDTVFSVAQKCGVSVSRLIEENALRPPYTLAQGEALFISHPSRTYRVRAKENISAICERFGIDRRALLRANPYLAKDGFLYPGQIIVPCETEAVQGALSIFGYAKQGTRAKEIKSVLPYLSALTVEGGSLKSAKIELPSLEGYCKEDVPLFLAGLQVQESELPVLSNTDTLVFALKAEGFGGICLHLDAPNGTKTMANIKALHEKLENAGLAFFVQSTEAYMQNESFWARECAALSDGLFLLEGNEKRSLSERLGALDASLSCATRSRVFCAFHTEYTEQTIGSAGLVSSKKGPLYEAKHHAHTKKRPIHRKDGMGCAYYEFPVCTNGKLGVKRFVFEDVKSLEASFSQLARCGGVVCRACESALPFLYMLSCSFAVNGF